MLGLDQLHHLLVDLTLGLGRAGKGSVTAQILVVNGLQCHHVKFIAHAVAGQHGAGQFGGLLDIIGSTGGDGVEHHFFGGTPAGEGGDLVFQLLLVHQVVVALVHLHGVTQSTRGAGDDGDLLHGGGVGLFSGDQSVADLMVGYDALFVVGQDGVLLLVACNDHLNALLQVRLGHTLAACADGPQRGLVDNVGQLGTGHGVGYVLNVHEGPNGFRWRVVPERHDNGVLEEGMITTDEPGVYLEGKYGIRTENELVCHKAEKNEYGQFMEFENITYAPIDLDAIDPDLLSAREKKMLNDYHKMVYDTISPYMTAEENEWLKRYTRAI